MDKEELIRNLKYTMEKHKNDFVPTFGTNIFVMCQDILNYLEGEHCADAVSRQEVLNLFNNSDEYDWEMSLLKKKIKDLPPVKPVACITEIEFSKEDMQKLVNEKIKEITPTRKKGKWINIMPCATNFQDQIIYQCVCDSCSSIAYFRKMCGKLVGAKLCPNCGEEMESELIKEVEE